jgi:nucleotide-binding universal stress UspA family protein
MFQRLLVPLDGSRMAEAALPAARRLAETPGSVAALLHVIERNAAQTVHDQTHLTTVEEARAYLEGLAGQGFPAGAEVRCHVHDNEVSDVSASIVEHAKESNIDLIVMSAHGRGGLRHVLFGNIALRVIASSDTPVLLIPPPEPQQVSRFSCEKLLAPLDGNPDHERGLEAAMALGQGCATHVHLVMVIPTWRHLTREHAITSKLLPGATAALLDMSQTSAQQYLDSRVRKLKTERRTVTAEVARGDPAAVIVEAARASNADVIVLGTHGKTRLDAFWAGSTTPKIFRRSRLPLLLVPVDETRDDDLLGRHPPGREDARS